MWHQKDDTCSTTMLGTVYFYFLPFRTIYGDWYEVWKKVFCINGRRWRWWAIKRLGVWSVLRCSFLKYICRKFVIKNYFLIVKVLSSFSFAVWLCVLRNSIEKLVTYCWSSHIESINFALIYIFISCCTNKFCFKREIATFTHYWISLNKVTRRSLFIYFYCSLIKKLF